MKRLGRISVMTVGIIALTLILGVASSRQVRAAVSALVTVANTAANPVPTQDVDAKNAFQANLNVGFNSQQVNIPAGQRLVIDYVAIHGFVGSTQGPVQPSVLFEPSLNGAGGSATYYLQPGPTPVNLPGLNQLYLSQPVKICADSLSVAGAFAGYNPDIGYTLAVSISGHLIPIP